ncbi:MAG: hypothetical protein WB795_17955 [Candidatus Acidiferrales bacterium]
MARGQGESRPIQFQVWIPADTQPGTYRLTAMGRVSGGEVQSEAVTIDLEKSEEPVGIWAEPALIQFARVGDEIPARLLGAFAGGSNEELTKSSKTAFSSAATRRDGERRRRAGKDHHSGAHAFIRLLDSSASAVNRFHGSTVLSVPGAHSSRFLGRVGVLL